MHSHEFKADAVKLVQAGGRTVGQVAKDLDLTETALRAWVRQAEVDAGQGAPEALTTGERNELARRGARTSSCGWSARSEASETRISMPASSGESSGWLSMNLMPSA